MGAHLLRFLASLSFREGGYALRLPRFPPLVGEMSKGQRGLGASNGRREKRLGSLLETRTADFDGAGSVRQFPLWLRHFSRERGKPYGGVLTVAHSRVRLLCHAGHPLRASLRFLACPSLREGEDGCSDTPRFPHLWVKCPKDKGGFGRRMTSGR